MRLLTVLLFGVFLVATQVFLVLKAMQDNLFERDVDPVDAVMERQASISDELTPQERLWLSKNHTVRVGVDPDFYPLEKFDAEGRYTGIGPDYLRILHKMTGLSFRIAPPSDWTNTIDMATSHKVDMYIAAAETQHRSQYMLFTPSYIVLPGIIVTRQPTKGESVTRGAATDETEPSIDGLKDLAGKRVAVVNRYSWHDFLEELHPEITPVPVKNTLEGLQKVAFGEVDAMIDYQFNITEKINNSGIRNLRAAGSIDAPYGHAFGIRKDWPELHSIINKALSKITPEERRIIAQKWLQPYEKKAFSKQTIWMMLFAAEVLFTVFAFVLYWNFSLKRQVSRRTAQLNQELAKYDRAEKELRESRAMLEQSNVELEHRVNERTRDLQAINAELQLAKEAADAATTAKSQFLANISHEIRTPLHGIMAFAELALLKEKTPPHRYLRAILQSSRALLEIINDLLDVSKIEAGHLELEQAPIMLDDVVHHVCTVALHNAHAGGIELGVDMDPNMQIALIGDAGRLQQIIMNLVTNAVKFTGPGGQICVTLKQGHAEPLPSDTCPEQRRVQIICFVRDTGVGIAPEFLGQLFQPFRQVDASTTRRHGGTGLGLCICRQLVEMMHGEIWVESEPNVGSTFAFSIPLCTQPDSGATAQLPPPPAQPIHALVLSASPLQTEILCRHFSALGIDALTATNTEEAVRKAQELPKKQPDLLFLDRKLSEPNTLYALRALRTAFGRTIPAILMDEHAGEQILSVSNRDAAQHDGQVAILSLVTLRGLHESIVSLNEPCLVAYSGRLHPQPSPMETPLFHDVRILVAEDNPTNQEIMEALFEDTGVQLTIVSNGKQALDALRVGAQRGERFDLVLMDVQMPVMDGYEATRIIRTMPELEGLPIVAITAHAMHEDKMRALSAGIARYLSKPLSRAALFGTLRALLPNKILPRKPEQATHRSESAALSAPIVLNNTALPPCLDAGAIERLNVSPETYQKILRGYVRNTSEALPALRKGLYLDPAMPEQALCRPAWEWLIREAHNLKGASANVGAIAVQQDAHALELALKQFVRQSGNAAVETAALAQTFSPLLGALEEAFATVQTSVLEALPETPQPQEAPPQPVQAGTLDEDQKAQLQHFKEMLALADPERIAEALMPLTAFLPSALMEKLQQAIDFYDYDEALALLPPDTL